MKYHYFVSYAMENGFGSCSIFRNKPIQNIKDLSQVKQAICEDYNHESIVILNFQQFPFKEE